MSEVDSDAFRWRPKRTWLDYTKLFAALAVAGYTVHWFINQI